MWTCWRVLHLYLELIYVCWRPNVHTCIWWGHRKVSVKHLNREPIFQPCSHPTASKQQMAGLGAVADLVQSCLLGSNCVLTRRETEYYSHAGKQIIVTSLVSRWLICLMSRWSKKKINRPVMLHGLDTLLYVCRVSACMHLTVCLPICLSTCLSTRLSPQQLPVCFLIYQPVCFCIVADVSMLRVFILESVAEEKLFKWITAAIHSP